VFQEAASGAVNTKLLTAVLAPAFFPPESLSQCARVETCWGPVLEQVLVSWSSGTAGQGSKSKTAEISQLCWWKRNLPTYPPTLTYASRILGVKRLSLLPEGSFLRTTLVAHIFRLDRAIVVTHRRQYVQGLHRGTRDLIMSNCASAFPSVDHSPLKHQHRGNVSSLINVICCR